MALREVMKEEKTPMASKSSAALNKMILLKKPSNKYTYMAVSQNQMGTFLGLGKPPHEVVFLKGLSWVFTGVQGFRPTAIWLLESAKS